MSLVNITGLKDASPEVFITVPAGTYRARITKIEEKVTGPNSQHPGSPMLVFTTKLVDENANGQVLFMNIMLPTENMDEDKKRMCISRIKRVGIACGLNMDDDAFDTGDFMGQEFKAVVSLTTTDGVKKNEIKDQLPL